MSTSGTDANLNCTGDFFKSPFHGRNLALGFVERRAAFGKYRIAHAGRGRSVLISVRARHPALVVSAKVDCRYWRLARKCPHQQCRAALPGRRSQRAEPTCGAGDSSLPPTSGHRGAGSTTCDFSGSTTLRWLEFTALNAMTAGNGELEPRDTSFGTTRGSLSCFLLRRNWHYWLAELKLHSVCEADVLTVSLPDSLRFLYPLLRLPLWLWRHSARQSSAPN